ncbi:MAG: choice-of-anchor Q domain-containing protein, partial [Tepidisphaeraceae bacterium]
MENVSQSLPILTNSILWSDSSGGGGREIANDPYGTSGSIPIINNCDVDLTTGYIGGFTGGAGNINSDPLFGNSAGGNYQLQASSPCINAGANSAPGLVAIGTDPAGNPRIVGGVVEMGAYEWMTPPLQPLVISDNPGVSDWIYVKNDNGTLKWWIAPAAGPMPNPATDTPTGSEAQIQISTLTILGLDGVDTIVLDVSGGILSDPSSGGVSVDGGSGGQSRLLLEGLSSTVDLTALPIVIGPEKIGSLLSIGAIGFADGAVDIGGVPTGLGL